VKKLATGYITIAEGSEITAYNPGVGTDADTPYGVVMGLEPVFDGNVMQPTDHLLSGGGVYGTNFERQTFARVVPIQAGIWSVAFDATSASFDTYAELLAAVGSTVDMVNSNLPTSEAEPELDIATIQDANSINQVFKIYGFDVSEDNRDYAAIGLRMLVIANLYQDAAGTAGI
jgi:hypothetical protein